ncbi:MAG: hypothetical protein U1E39_14680 [Planctomycetota bacterium]
MYRVAAALAVVFAAGCASAAARAPVDVPAGRAPTPDDAVAREVGALLSGDVAAARAAEADLVALDASGRAALARHAATIPNERDPRWLHVLDAHGLLPALSPDEAVAFRLAEAARGEPGLLARARAALEAQARRDPAPLVARLRGGPGADLLALALGDAGATSAAPALLALYKDPRAPAERRAAAAALATCSRRRAARTRTPPGSTPTSRRSASDPAWTRSRRGRGRRRPPRRHPVDPADRPMARRPRARWLASAVVGAAVLATAGVVLVPAPRASRADEPAVAAAERALEAGDVPAALAAFRALADAPTARRTRACSRASAPRSCAPARRATPSTRSARWCARGARPPTAWPTRTRCSPSRAARWRRARDRASR